MFPNNIGRAYHGSPAGGSVSAINETVVTNFLGGTNLATTLAVPVAGNGSVTLVWSALEGGSYQVEAATNLSHWTVLASNVAPNQISGVYTDSPALDHRCSRASVSPTTGSMKRWPTRAFSTRPGAMGTGENLRCRRCATSP